MHACSAHFHRLRSSPVEDCFCDVHTRWESSSSTPLRFVKMYRHTEGGHAKPKNLFHNITVYSVQQKYSKSQLKTQSKTRTQKPNSLWQRPTEGCHVQKCWAWEKHRQFARVSWLDSTNTWPTHNKPPTVTFVLQGCHETCQSQGLLKSCHGLNMVKSWNRQPCTTNWHWPAKVHFHFLAPMIHAYLFGE